MVRDIGIGPRIMDPEMDVGVDAVDLTCGDGWECALI
jgi:hypothetical protein